MWVLATSQLAISSVSINEDSATVVHFSKKLTDSYSHDFLVMSTC